MITEEQLLKVIDTAIKTNRKNTRKWIIRKVNDDNKYLYAPLSQNKIKQVLIDLNLKKPPTNKIIKIGDALIINRYGMLEIQYVGDKKLDSKAASVTISARLKNLVQADKQTKRKKPWKLSSSDLNYLLEDIQKRGYLLRKPIKTLVAGIIADYNKGYIDPDKHFPLSGSYVNSINLLNIVLDYHGLDKITSLKDPLINR